MLRTITTYASFIFINYMANYVIFSNIKRVTPDKISLGISYLVAGQRDSSYKVQDKNSIAYIF